MHYRRCFALLSGFVLSTFLGIASAQGQSNSYKQTNLTSDTAGVAANVDPMLINPWGIAYFPNQPFWIADNNSGFSTLYNQNGIPSGQFLVPGPMGSTHTSTPTGIVANLGLTGFTVNRMPSQFIFDAEDGTISGWNGIDPVTRKVDNSRFGAVYKGLGMVINESGTFLLATNFNSGNVEVFTEGFSPVAPPGAFVDPSLPAGYAPFGIHLVNGQVLVTYALQDQAKHDPIHQAGAGYVNLFDVDGNFIRRVASQGTLNAPWGAVIAPASFGAFGTKLLIGNFGDGTISVFDFTSGNFIDQIKDSTGALIVNASLWDMVFGGGGASGDPNTMYITAGLANEQHGLFASIVPNTGAGTGGADFSVTPSATTATVNIGQSTSLQITVDGLDGFASAVQFTCSGEPANSQCTFSPSSVTPTNGQGATTTLTVATRMPGGIYGQVFDGPRQPSGVGPLVAAISLLLVGLLFSVKTRFEDLFKRRKTLRLVLLGAASFLLLSAPLLSLGGCGSYNSSGNNNGTQPGTSTLVVTATSGTISHSTHITLTVQ
jgi:uncharacterized protein (TIGR03118 family)